jgi:putative DNA primase/helicase
MVRGALKWRKEGIGDPPEVISATATYRHEQDFLAPFLNECCEVASDHEESVGALYERFKSWAEESGEKPISRKRLSAMLKERGFDSYQDSSDHRFYWKGVKLK